MTNTRAFAIKKGHLPCPRCQGTKIKASFYPLPSLSEMKVHSVPRCADCGFEPSPLLYQIDKLKKDPSASDVWNLFVTLTVDNHAVMRKFVRALVLTNDGVIAAKKIDKEWSNDFGGSEHPYKKLNRSQIALWHKFMLGVIINNGSYKAGVGFLSEFASFNSVATSAERILERITDSNSQVQFQASSKRLRDSWNASLKQATDNIIKRSGARIGATDMQMDLSTYDMAQRFYLTRDSLIEIMEIIDNGKG